MAGALAPAAGGRYTATATSEALEPGGDSGGGGGGGDSEEPHDAGGQEREAAWPVTAAAESAEDAVLERALARRL